HSLELQSCRRRLQSPGEWNHLPAALNPPSSTPHLFHFRSPACAAEFAKQYQRPSCFFAAATTFSGSKPNFLWSSFKGAEAPKVSMPITQPEVPTYRSHPKVDACSTATRAFT